MRVACWKGTFTHSFQHRLLLLKLLRAVQNDHLALRMSGRKMKGTFNHLAAILPRARPAGPGGCLYRVQALQHWPVVHGLKRGRGWSQLQLCGGFCRFQGVADTAAFHPAYSNIQSWGRPPQWRAAENRLGQKTSEGSRGGNSPVLGLRAWPPAETLSISSDQIGSSAMVIPVRLQRHTTRAESFSTWTQPWKPWKS